MKMLGFMIRIIFLIFQNDSNYFFDISKYRNYLIIPQSKMPLLDEITKKESIIIYK